MARDVGDDAQAMRRVDHAGPSGLLGDLLFGTLSKDRLPPEPPEPIIPERIKSFLGGGSRMDQKPGRRNPVLVGRSEQGD